MTNKYETMLNSGREIKEEEKNKLNAIIQEYKQEVDQATTYLKMHGIDGLIFYDNDELFHKLDLNGTHIYAELFSSDKSEKAYSTIDEVADLYNHKGMILDSLAGGRCYVGISKIEAIVKATEEISRTMNILVKKMVEEN